MSERAKATPPAGFDLAGAASDLDARARRYAPIYDAAPDLGACIRLLHRNPSIASAVRRAIEKEMAKLPGGGVGLDVALFPATKGS